MKKLVTKFFYIIKSSTFIQSLSLFYNIYINSLNNFKIKKKWRNLNKHNSTFIANSDNETYFPFGKVTVGKFSYGPLIVHHFGSINEKLVIGNYCSISHGVKFILGGNHSLNTFSTFPFRYYYNQECEAWSKGPIIVEDDVWIGTDSIILSGITLGKGSVVAAGSVVTKSSLPYSIIGGNPAKLIKMRFDEEMIRGLIGVDFEKIDEKKIPFTLLKLSMPLNKKLLTEITNDIVK